MRKSESETISPSKEGNGNRSGVRTRKKHKRLDAISEDVYNQNRGVKLESNEGTSSRGELVGKETELRRSSRAIRAPVILDSSPAPSRKRRKIDKIEGNVSGGSGKKLRGKGNVKNDGPIPSVVNLEEELGALRLRVRSRGKSEGLSLIGSRNKARGKRKLCWDDDEDIKSVKDDPVEEEPCLDSDKSRAMKSSEPDSGRVSVDDEDELHDDHLEDGNLENGVNAIGDEGDGDCMPSTSGRIVGNEEIRDGSLVHLVDIESEGPKDDIPMEKVDSIDNMVGDEKNHEALDSLKHDEGDENHNQVAEVTAMATDLAEDVGHDVLKEVAEVKEIHAEVDSGADQADCNVAVGGIPKSRVKKGRRCGLCGGGTDGKPPKVTANDSAGSDNEAYSGSSASEECNYDPWDGFGDEPGWLGRLLGPINDRYGIAGIWVHQHCAVWSPEVYFAGLGCLRNIRAALCRGRALKCTRCGRPGATLGCRVDRCPRTYHLPCARASGCIFDHRKFLIACADHRHHFQPHGFQYAQHMKKLKAKKVRLELRKVSNDASRKDLEAEEKWLEKCGEDEEFLKRESKRLQRDLLRIAPVYIGGPHSEGQNSFEGWESVAGLQGVIQCMKEVVILPLLYPEFFKNMGITPPRGVLLHGYPGTGKTLVVRSLIGACARGDKRIAYFARKGADCLGKYVGDAERQLRLLFQVAEKSQPSIIFFDEIDGLAPVRTRQQDQTHSSVVSTLLALMDGLKSRGSVIVIGATNRPDAVDPALRRPGRFDREVYFPLPSTNDRAAILALHTRKWPKPVSGTLLEWVSARTVGFAGADLQALCAQAAVIALKRNCSWHQIISYAEDNLEQGKRPQLPSFVVEEKDWLEALSLAPPPCSRRVAGMAANEVVGSPLHMHLITFLLQPLLSLMISLYLDDRLWLPRRLVYAAAAIERVVVSVLEKKGLQSDKWWCHAQDMVQDAETKEIVRNLLMAGILEGDASSAGCDMSRDTSSGDGGFRSSDLHVNTFGSHQKFCDVLSKKIGYRIMISGDPRSGQKHLASCLLHCFVGSIEMQKIDLATISQEGHGDMEQGISNILMKCASLKMCGLFMPRIDLWAVQSCPSVQEDVEVATLHQSSKESLSTSRPIDHENCSPIPSKSEPMEVTAYQYEDSSASQIWRSFVEHLEYIRVSSSLIILATSEIPSSALPAELRQFFGCDILTSEGSVHSEYGTPRFSVEVEREFHHDKLIHSAALDLSQDLIQQFLQLVHIGNHGDSDSSTAYKARHGGKVDVLSHHNELKLMEEPRANPELAEGSIAKLPAPSASRNGKGKSSVTLAITTFGYQILRYPHFAELCWITSKLNEGPSTDVRGPWKGWPFNSCIVRPSKSVAKETVACNTNSSKGKDQFTLVRGLLAVGLSAYRGVYTSPLEVSLEVRKVLELLIEQIATRIQAGKDRYQYFRLLSQVAYLEDMVNSWSYSLKSLEADAQTSIVNSKLNGAQCPETVQVLEDPTEESLQACSAENPLHTPGDNSIQVEKEPNIPGNGFQQPELEVVLPETIAVSAQPADSNVGTIDSGNDNLTEAVSLIEESRPTAAAITHVPQDVYSEVEVINEEKESADQILSGSNMVSSTNCVDSVHQSYSIIPQKFTGCEEPELEHFEDISVTGGRMLTKQESSQLACTESLDQPAAGICNSEKLENTGLHVSSEFCNQTIIEPLVENEISSEAGNCTSDLQLHDSKSSQSNDLSSESEAICSYSCCSECIYTLQQLLKKKIAQEWKLSSSCCTVEDVHDLVSALSSSLCSTIRNLYSIKRCSNSENGGLRKLESQEENACQCEASENKLANLVECVCHSGKDFCKKVDPSSYNQPESSLTYLFRNGVLISANSDNESSFHCEYDTLCLSSLIKVIENTRQALD
ncbi:uncharacterized protein LOC110686954 [Chenopodium quinoa]|uniref:uncharacterized protein LOC110686954 n=1 Tax=Chenopodium quinoa TaxID=63459 RepID=UPI000B770EF4|nr:uncharacterized protein LOC110686954 [Chenopodium quinoa]